jgi:2-polyprenyl-6-methoxyphenol hydroxylase-like FAD-dependent oxidoreductase
MREIVHDALADAREMVGQVVSDLRGEARLTDDEVLARYEREHQGRPWAIVDFARQQSPGGDVLGQAMRYEEQMERLMRQRQRGG